MRQTWETPNVGRADTAGSRIADWWDAGEQRELPHSLRPGTGHGRLAGEGKRGGCVSIRYAAWTVGLALARRKVDRERDIVFSWVVRVKRSTRLWRGNNTDLYCMCAEVSRLAFIRKLR